MYVCAYDVCNLNVEALGKWNLLLLYNMLFSSLSSLLNLSLWLSLAQCWYGLYSRVITNALASLGFSVVICNPLCCYYSYLFCICGSVVFVVWLCVCVFASRSWRIFCCCCCFLTYLFEYVCGKVFRVCAYLCPLRFSLRLRCIHLRYRVVVVSCFCIGYCFVVFVVVVIFLLLLLLGLILCYHVALLLLLFLLRLLCFYIEIPACYGN